MRRSLLLASLLAVLAGLTVTAVTLAGDRSGPDRSSRAERTDRSAPTGPSAFERASGRFGRREGVHRRDRSGHGMLHARLLGELADRLEVSDRDLRRALRGVKRRTLERAVARGTITDAQRDAVLACRADRVTCDRTTVRAARRALARDARPGALAARKQELAEDLGAELGREPASVLTAIRAELVEKLDLAVTLGAVTARGRDLALACFDAPGGCDVEALKAEVRIGPGHGRHGR